MVSGSGGEDGRGRGGGRASVLTQDALRSWDRDRLLSRWRDGPPRVLNTRRLERAASRAPATSWGPGQAGEGVRAVRLQRGTAGPWATT